jgi:hypothetical protein
MGGDVWYERRFPTGSRFCFSMPVKALVSEESPAATPHTDPAIIRQ